MILKEVGILLIVLGYVLNIFIYIVVGEIYGGEFWLVSFGFCFIMLMSKVLLYSFKMLIYYY